MFRDFIDKSPRGTIPKLAKEIGVTPEALWLIYHGRRNPSPSLAIKIEKATKDQVSRYDLLDNASEIWGPNNGKN